MIARISAGASRLPEAIDRAVAVGESRYLEHGKLARLYYNVWLLRFDTEGRCSEFVEYWREHPKDSLPG